MAIPLKVRGIGTSKHKTDEYVFEASYFFAISNKGQKVVTYICHKLYLVNNLKTNILIKNDIIDTEGITINIVKKKAYVSGCKALFLISAW